SEDWVVNPKNKGVRWAVVFLVAPSKGAKLAVHPELQKIDASNKEVVIDQPACRFEPHVVAIREGQVVVAKNSSPLTHNTRWSGIKNPGDNKTIPSGGLVNIDDLKAADFPVQVQCNIHPWMQSWIYVFNNPYHTVTDADGNFEIKLAPAGACRLTVWQEKIGWKDGDRTGQ